MGGRGGKQLDGNSVSCCLYLDLERRGYINTKVEANQQRRPLKHLAIASDSCSSQNKNKAVIRFCYWLVKANCMTKVTLLFLIKGHTKCYCGREFNLLKEYKIGPFAPIEEANAYYTHLDTHHSNEIIRKKVAKNKARNEKKG